MTKSYYVTLPFFLGLVTGQSFKARFHIFYKSVYFTRHGPRVCNFLLIILDILFVPSRLKKFTRRKIRKRCNQRFFLFKGEVEFVVQVFMYNGFNLLEGCFSCKIGRDY